MVWDYIEINPFDDSWGWMLAFSDFGENILRLTRTSHLPASCQQGSAAALPYEDNFFNCVVTDPPYYDNIGYSDLSDFFYIWLRRSLNTI